MVIRVSPTPTARTARVRPPLLAASLKRSVFVCRKRGKKGEKNGKGLRHFSMKVCEKVQKKGVTTYNEVADELVAEFSSSDNHMSPNDAVSAAVQRLLTE